MSNGFVVAMGMGTVFIGLICLVFLCKIMDAVVRHFDHSKAKEMNHSESIPDSAGRPAVTVNRGEWMAAVSAALAEENGTDVSGIKIVSMKKISEGSNKANGAVKAAVAAALAEELGTGVAALRIVSFKRCD